MRTITIATDFTPYPGLHYQSLSENSAEEFYYTVLNPAFAACYKDNTTLTMDLDGTEGYAATFLDECFGRLIYDFGRDVVYAHLGLKSEDEPHWISFITGPVMRDWTIRRAENVKPTYTGNFGSWCKLEGGVMRVVQGH